MSLRTKFILILVLGVVAGVLAYPHEDTILHAIGFKNSHLTVKEGLDLKGGSYLVYQADMSKVPQSQQASQLSGLVQVIQRRVNPSGTNEDIVQEANGNRVIIQLPGNQDVQSAVNIIGKTGKLEFLQSDQPTTDVAQMQPTGITGADVQSATPDIDPQTGQPIVRLQLKGGKPTDDFGKLTTALNQSGGYMTTVLDQQIVFGPATIRQPITDGTAILQGNFTIQQAKQTAELINAGALPVPISLVQQQTVGATLGAESVARSFVAGIIGLTVVALFMIIYYRLAGVLAVLALSMYTVLTLAIYKLSALTPWTIVLTLAGIAGFILSIGMAVDANILIFERMKEELRAGKSPITALEAGFDRAWTSIRDSNVSTLITCIILYVFSGSTPIIKGFAVTLGLGVVISMFTAVVVTRTFLRMAIRNRGLSKHPAWFGLQTGVVK